jgi:hypothetical protein
VSKEIEPVTTHVLVVAALFYGQATTSPRPLAMAEVHACAIEYVSRSALSAKWGGQIAVYDAATDAEGDVVRLKRRIVEGREHLPPLVKLDQFERCVRRWRFGERAGYEVSLFGGPALGVDWVIQVREGDRQIRLRMRAIVPD